jgi:hypothetical protein
MVNISLRLNPATVQRLGWKADEIQQSRADAARSILDDALRGQKPPADAFVLVIRASDAERERWLQAAEQRNQSVDEFARALLNKGSALQLGSNN